MTKLSALYVSIFAALRKKAPPNMYSACLKTTLKKDMLTLNYVTTLVPVANVSAASLVAPQTL